MLDFSVNYASDNPAYEMFSTIATDCSSMDYFIFLLEFHLKVLKGLKS